MIDKKTIEQIAKLARLQMTEQEASSYSEQLSKALKHFEQISKINTDGVEPLVTPTEIEAVWREDIAKNDLSTEEILANAPAKAGNLYKVPPVVG